jgi:anti-sigma factor RsiW
MNWRLSKKEQLDELLSAYLDDELAPEERRAVEVRLEREPALRERLEDLRATVRFLADAPKVDVPRNFILTPSMVDQAGKTAAPVRRRQTWPFLSWATAVATLLLIFVLAGDFFVISPSLETAQDARSTVLDSQVEEAAPAGALAATPTPAPMGTMEPMLMEETAEEALEAAEEDAMPEEKEAGAAEMTVMVTQEVEAEGEVAAEAIEQPAEFTTEEPPVAMAPTGTVAVEKQILKTPGPPEPASAVPRSASPPPERENGIDVTEPAVAQAQSESVPAEAEARETEQRETITDIRWWLRAVEILLALVVVGLAAATIFVRRRQV